MGRTVWHEKTSLNSKMNQTNLFFFIHLCRLFCLCVPFHSFQTETIDVIFYTMNQQFYFSGLYKEKKKSFFYTHRFHRTKKHRTELVDKTNEKMWKEQKVMIRIKKGKDTE